MIEWLTIAWAWLADTWTWLLALCATTTLAIVGWIKAWRYKRQSIYERGRRVRGTVEAQRAKRSLELFHDSARVAEQQHEELKKLNEVAHDDDRGDLASRLDNAIKNRR